MTTTASDVPATLGELLARTVKAHGTRPAVMDSKKTLSWHDLAGLADGYGAQLRTAGVGRGDRVALWLPNSADYLALIFAAARIGAVAVHVNSRYRAQEVGSLLRRAMPVVLVSDFGGSADFHEVLAQVPVEHKASLRRILVRGASSSIRMLDGVPVAPLEAAGTTGDEGRAEEACAIFTTTGSTGEPKLAMHRQRGLAEHNHYAACRLGFDQPGATLLANLPFCGVGGHTWAMMAVAGGAAIVLWDSADIDGLIRRRRVTHMTGFSDGTRLDRGRGARPAVRQHAGVRNSRVAVRR